eukprot:3194259-Pleurochrysis_carterae.AAC.1
MRLAGKRLRSPLAVRVEPPFNKCSSRAGDGARQNRQVGRRSGGCRGDWHRVWAWRRRSKMKKKAE